MKRKAGAQAAVGATARQRNPLFTVELQFMRNELVVAGAVATGKGFFQQIFVRLGDAVGEVGDSNGTFTIAYFPARL